MSDEKKKEPKPICADCRKRKLVIGICLDTGKKVKRTNPTCDLFISKNPRY